MLGFDIRTRIILLFTLLLFTNASTLFAQVPEGINYQAVARNTDGAPLADTALNVQITIASDVNLNTIDFSEVHSVVTNRYGLFTLIIGNGVPT